MKGSFVSPLVDVPIQQPVVQRITPVGAAEAALIPETVAFKDYDARFIKKESDRQQEIRRRSAILDRIRTKASQFSNDPYALYLLAEAESVSGTPAAAEAAVDRLLSIQPNNVRGLIRKSLLLSDAAGKLSGQARLDKAAQARAIAVRANQADPNEPLDYVAFYESYHSAGLKTTQNALEGLEAAVEKLPDDTHIRRMLVEEYAAERQWRAAIQALGPIANDPHDSPLRDEARERMAQLEAQLKAQNGTAAAAK
jgi:tetratricopeptide (TPR) repeat protein